MLLGRRTRTGSASLQAGPGRLRHKTQHRRGRLRCEGEGMTRATSEMKCAGCGTVGWALMWPAFFFVVCAAAELRCPNPVHRSYGCHQDRPNGSTKMRGGSGCCPSPLLFFFCRLFFLSGECRISCDFESQFFHLVNNVFEASGGVPCVPTILCARFGFVQVQTK